LPRFDRMILCLRRMRWAAGVSGMILGGGFGAGKNASKNNVAGRTQKSIAALSIEQASVGRNAVQDARVFRRPPSGSIRVCTVRTASLVSLPDYPIFLRSPVTQHRPLRQDSNFASIASSSSISFLSREHRRTRLGELHIGPLSWSQSQLFAMARSSPAFYSAGVPLS